MSLRIVLILSALIFALYPPEADRAYSFVWAETVSTSDERGVTQSLSGTKERLDSLFLDLKDASCTDRCHVNSLSYRNDFEGEVFRHATHPPSLGWGLHCVDCHEDKEVNREGHGKLTIGKKECLDCHHVDNRNESCARCHKDIDTKPMEYKGEHFVHGFTVNSGINCKECHLIDPKSSMKEGINCNKCHHTRPRMACTGCHEQSLTKVYYPRLADMDYLGWTAGFLHSQHPEVVLSCQECHPPREDRAKGVGEYQAHCGQCHHKKKPALDPERSEGEGADCQKCHQVVFQFLNGKPPVGGIKPIPDKMSRAVKCEDCHKPLKGGGGFSGVGEECARCHNKHYAELLEAQRGVVSSWVDRLRKTLALSSYWWEAGGDVYEEAYGSDRSASGGLAPSGPESVLSGEGPALDPPEPALDPERSEGEGAGGVGAYCNTPLQLLDLVERYGLHNFLCSKGVLSLLEKNSGAMVPEGPP